ncbi:hypothetical protein BGX38DRAFT_1221143 [Terfezia claveryi]|nr:hypothetical protein BGX38DRAFT_1221143 [Terfezia claveryi]
MAIGGRPYAPPRQLYEIERLRLPVIGKFGHVNPADYDPAVVRLHMYEYYDIGRFLYFRFDEKNWIPKKAIYHYNQEWAHLAIPLHQAIEAKRVFSEQFELPVDAGDRVHNWFLPFFLAFVRRPKCVRHVWRYNLQFMHEDLLESWDWDNVEGNPPVPLFAGLTMVVKKLAPKMLIHILENRRQQWATSGLHNELATTTDLTMDKPEVAMEPFANVGMGGVRANYFPNLDIDEYGVADAAWDGALSW